MHNGEGQAGPSSSSAPENVVEAVSAGGATQVITTAVDSAVQEEKNRVSAGVKRVMDIFRKGECTRYQASSVSWTSGQESVIEKGRKLSTPTLPRSTHMSNHKGKTGLPHRRRPLHQERLTSPDHHSRDLKTRLKTSSIEFQEENQWTTMTENSVSSDGGLEKTKCHGLTQPSARHEGAAALRPVKPYVSLAKTQPGLRPSYESQTTFRKGSPPPSGTGCSMENLSTSTRSC